MPAVAFIPTGDAWDRKQQHAARDAVSRYAKASGYTMKQVFTQEPGEPPRKFFAAFQTMHETPNAVLIIPNLLTIPEFGCNWNITVLNNHGVYDRTNIP